MAIKITEEGKRTVKTERFAQWLQYLRTNYMQLHAGTQAAYDNIGQPWDEERFLDGLMEYLRLPYVWALGHEIGMEPTPAEKEEISEYSNEHEVELDEAIMAILYPPTKGTGYN
ncbi:MAG: hypothetical protein WAL71_09265 [Terriglobales bacterium]|jgi:hypothetical protein